MDDTGCFSGTAGLAVPAWPIKGLWDLAGGITADGFQAVPYSSWGKQQHCTSVGFFFLIWFDFFLPVKDCCKHWAFKLKGVNESVPVITITGSLVHSTVALRWFLIISKSIPEACSCCYSPPVHHRRCRFAAQHGRLKKRPTVLLQPWLGFFTFFPRRMSWGLPGTLLNISLG